MDGGSKISRGVASRLEELLPDGAVVRWARGSAPVRLTPDMTKMLVAFGIVFVYALLQGVVLWPGVLLLFLVGQQARPLRGVARTATELVVVELDGLGRPVRILARTPLGTVDAATVRQTGEVRADAEVVLLGKTARQRFTEVPRQRVAVYV